jgi:hypothetical protein
MSRAQGIFDTSPVKSDDQERRIPKGKYAGDWPRFPVRSLKQGAATIVRLKFASASSLIPVVSGVKMKTGSDLL